MPLYHCLPTSQNSHSLFHKLRKCTIFLDMWYLLLKNFFCGLWEWVMDTMCAAQNPMDMASPKWLSEGL